MYAFPTGGFGIPGYRISKTQLASGRNLRSQQTKAHAKKAWAFLFGNFRIAGLEARIQPSE